MLQREVEIINKLGLHARASAKLTQSPREAKIVAGVLATAAMNDFLQAGFNALCARSNIEQKRSEAAEERFSRPAAAG